DDLTIALRTRAPWEAADLGIALVRTHAARIYAAWIVTTLPIFLLLNAFACLLDWAWLAALATWWLKPLFDRIVLLVASRAVFGNIPSLRETLVAQRSWGWRGIAPWLLWRRFHPGRAMLLSVDLLEGVTGAQRRERVRVLGRGGGSPNIMLTFIGANLEAMLAISIVVLGLMFVPVEFLPDSAKAVWHALVENPPWWARVLLNFCGWIATAIVEPFYIGAGFGLYLNRRMQLEGWDIEVAFRRIAARLSPILATAALVLVALFAWSAPLRAAQPPAAETHVEKPADAAPGEKGKPDIKAVSTTLQDMFGDGYSDDGKEFEAAVNRAYAEDDLSPKTRTFVWRQRHPDVAEVGTPGDVPGWARAMGGALGFLVQYGLWIVIAVVLVLVILNHRRWLPWISDRFVPVRRADDVSVHDVAAIEPLPEDIPAAVRELLRQSRVRAALALLYRAGVGRLSDVLGTSLPPGTTEAECLRQSRRLRDPHFAALFARIVRGWQAAAYAQRPPPASEVEAILVDWSAPTQETLA
ncbi:MAG: DUF4129 domain-containing protein, partial [Dokdonella sp.]